MLARAPASLAILALALGVASGCDQKTAEPSAALPVAQAPSPSVPASATKHAAVLAAYEQMRALLAGDAIDRVAEPAGALAKAAEADAAQAIGGTGRILREIATTSTRVQAMDKTDPDAVRKEFGEVSRAFVALLRAEPGLRTGLHLFHCPMAQGFPHWVQTSETIANPYMGKQMLACGSPRNWE